VVTSLISVEITPCGSAVLMQ